MTDTALIEKLEAQLGYVYDMLVGNENNRFNSGERMNAIFRQVKLMLALIEGYKGA